MKKRIILSSCLLAAMSLNSVAVEPAKTMQSVKEAKQTIAIGQWQGNWNIIRIDSKIKTRAGEELITVQIIQDKNSPKADLNWVTGRAICPEINAEPCEWIGVSSAATQAHIYAGQLLASLNISSDDSDPLILLLIPEASKNKAKGILVSHHGDIKYQIEAERLP